MADIAPGQNSIRLPNSIHEMCNVRYARRRNFTHEMLGWSEATSTGSNIGESFIATDCQADVDLDPILLHLETRKRHTFSQGIGISMGLVGPCRLVRTLKVALIQITRTEVLSDANFSGEQWPAAGAWAAPCKGPAWPHLSIPWDSHSLLRFDGIHPSSSL